MTRQQDAVVAALALVLALAAPASAQQPADQRRVDSLAAEVRALKARLDSVRAQLAHRPAAAEPAVDTSLAALRAAAAAAAGTDTSRIRVDTAGRTKFVGRERSQPQLNPEISATGDVRAYGYSPGVQRDNFDAREFEVGFQSPLDPYSSTKIFVSFENGNVSIEEGYAYWTGLPGRCIGSGRCAASCTRFAKSTPAPARRGSVGTPGPPTNSASVGSRERDTITSKTRSSELSRGK